MDKENNNIASFTVYTPDHTHASISMADMEKVKHVYVQKPLTWSVYEARTLTEAARKYKVVTQQKQLKMILEINFWNF